MNLAANFIAIAIHCRLICKQWSPNFSQKPKFLQATQLQSLQDQFQKHLLQTFRIKLLEHHLHLFHLVNQLQPPHNRSLPEHTRSLTRSQWEKKARGWCQRLTKLQQARGLYQKVLTLAQKGERVWYGALLSQAWTTLTHQPLYNVL